MIEIEFFLANNVLQPMQYNSNKHAGVSLSKFCFLHKIKEKATDKLFKKSRLDYNDIKKTVFFNSSSNNSIIQSMFTSFYCTCVIKIRDENYAIKYYISLYLVQNKA